LDSVTAPGPIAEVLFGSDNVTAAITPFLIRLEVTDYMEGQSDELEITLEDREGVFRGIYWPAKGDDLTVAIGYDSGPLKGLWPAGTYVLDEVEAAGPPSTMTLRALSSSVKAAGQRQLKSRGFENQTLAQIAKKVADGWGGAVVGNVPAVTIQRATQSNETDLQFLARMARKFGAVMKVQGYNLVFHKLQDLIGMDLLYRVEPQDVTQYRFRAKTCDVPAQRVVRVWNPQTKRMVSQAVTPKMQVTSVKTEPIPKAGPATRSIIAGDRAGRFDVDKLTDRVEDAAQAQVRMAAALSRAELNALEGNLTMPGDPRIRAGQSIGVLGFGDHLDGDFLVRRVRHLLERGQGMVTEVDLGSKPTKSNATAKRKVPKGATETKP